MFNAAVLLRHMADDTRRQARMLNVVITEKKKNLNWIKIAVQWKRERSTKLHNVTVKISISSISGRRCTQPNEIKTALGHIEKKNGILQSKCGT